MLDHPPDMPIDYPDSDGRPMGETDLHVLQIEDLHRALRSHFARRDDVAVHGDMLMFYEEGNRRKHLSPDVMVTFGIPPKPRKKYLIWEEGRAPHVIFEITSQSTSDEDLGVKRGLYEFLGVEEYYMFDPYAEYLVPPFRAWHLRNANFVPVVGIPLWSPRLQLELRMVDNALRLFDRTSNRLLRTHDELALEVEAQASRAREAEAEVARLRLELERFKNFPQ